MDGVPRSLPAFGCGDPNEDAVAWHGRSLLRILNIEPAKGGNVSDIERSDIAKRIAAHLDSGRQQSLSRQIVDCVWLEVVEGTLQTGDRMPTVRQLSIELGLTPRAVERAYQQLEQLGVLANRSGEGTFVSLTAPDAEKRDRWVKLEKLCREAASRARALGFSIDDLVDALADLRIPRNNSNDSARHK